MSTSKERHSSTTEHDDDHFSLLEQLQGYSHVGAWSEAMTPREERNQNENDLGSSVEAVVDTIDEDPTPPPPLQTPAVAAAAAAAATPVTMAQSTRKSLRRSNRKEFPPSFWYDMCERFSHNLEKYKSSQTEFLRHKDSGVLGYNDRQSFGNRMRAYKKGTLRRDDAMLRDRKGKYMDVERCLLAFLETRDQFADKGKMPISWPFLLEMAKRFAVVFGHPPGEFSGSPGWLANVLKRHKTKIDFEVSDTDALFCLDTIKRYCKKRKLGNEIRSMSVNLHNLVEKNIGIIKEADSDGDAPRKVFKQQSLEQHDPQNFAASSNEMQSNPFSITPVAPIPPDHHEIFASASATFPWLGTMEHNGI